MADEEQGNPPPDDESVPLIPASPPTTSVRTKAEVTKLEYSQAFVGPLPSPELLHQYEEAAPGSRERFLDDYFADKQHLRRLEQEDQDLRRDVAQGNLPLARRGQDRALVVGFGFGLLTAALALTGHDGVAIVTGGTTVVGIVGAFLASLRSTQSDRSEHPDAEVSRQTRTDSKKKTHGK